MPDKHLYNSRITSTYLKLVRRNYPYVDVDDLLHYAEMEGCQVEDEGHWFTQRQVNRFQERLIQLSGNEDIAKEAGAFTASPEMMGGIRRYLLGLASPASAYALVGRYTSKFTKSSIYESRKIGPNKVEVSAVPYSGVKEELFQCKNRLGYLEAISKIFGYRMPRIEHSECLFKGGRACRYIVSWQESPFVRWRKVRNFVALLLMAVNLLMYLSSPSVLIMALMIPSSISVFMLLLIAHSRHISSLGTNSSM